MQQRGLKLSDFSADHQLEVWYVVFSNGRESHWWDRWLKPYWRHCWALRWDGYNWIVVNPRTDRLEVGVSWVCDYTGIDVVIGEASAVLAVTAMIPKNRIRSRFFAGPVTCVEVTKALLGIRSMWTLTPWQLFKYLRSRNGRSCNFGPTG